MVGGKASISLQIYNKVTGTQPPPPGTQGEESGSGPSIPIQTPPIPPPGPKNFPYYVSAPVRPLHEKMFEQMVDLILRKAVFFNSDAERRKSPFQFQNPDALSKRINFNLINQPPLLLDRGGQDKLLKIMEDVIDFCPKPSHPFMVHKNSSGLDPYAIVGDWLSTTMSSPVLTYVLSPVFTLMELEVQERFRNLVGYPENQGDGIVVPGHGLANGYVIQVALQHQFPGMREKGINALEPRVRPVMFVSEQGDYSFEKYCIWEGVGMDGCIRVKAQDDGRMDLNDLRLQLQIAEKNNLSPFLIVATAGTPVIGAIDDVEKIARIAANRNVWFHVDGHLAGACVFSPNQRRRVKGIEKSDSVTFSADKMLAAPFCMNILVTKESKRLFKTFDSEYPGAVVFEQDPFYDHKKWDTGDSTMQTTRRPDVLKLWFMWRAKGLRGLADQVDGTYRNTEICLNEIKSRRGRFELLLPVFDSNLVCFYFIPSSIRYLGRNDIVRILKKNRTTETIKRILLEAGVMQISTGVLPRRNDLPGFFVMNMNNTAVTQADIKYMLDRIEFHGNRVISTTQVRELLSSSDDETMATENQDEVVSAEATSQQIKADEEEDRNFVPAIDPLAPVGINVIEPMVPPPPASYPDYVSAPIESMHKTLFQEYFKLVFRIGTYFQDKRDEPAFIFQQPEQLLQKFDFTLESKMGGQNRGYKSIKELMDTIEQIIFYTAKLSHPYYMFQLVSGLDPYTMMADYIATCMTSPMFTYEDSPPFTLMEDEVLKAIRQRAGYKDGSGLILVGGSIANQVPLLLGYIRKFKNSKAKGTGATDKTGVIYISEAGHYATRKGAFFQGIGTDNCVFVLTDDRGRMSPEDLENKVKQTIRSGKVPYMVCATVGTTVLGVYDPVPPIADICEKYKLWLHLDGSYGGSVILSDKEKFRLNGIERSDSFTFNPHKAFAAARYTTNWITRHKSILREVAPPPSRQYFRLNQGLYDQEKYDNGEFQMLCDRRPDVFKMWFLWKAKGTRGLGQHIDQGFELTDYAYKKLLAKAQQDPSYSPITKYPPECANVNFLYLPKQLVGKDKQDKDVKERIKCVQNTLLALILFNNKWISSVEGIANIPQHQIFCLYNTSMTRKDVDYFFDYIEYFAKNFDLYGLCMPDDNAQRLQEPQTSRTAQEKEAADLNENEKESQVVGE